MPLEEACASGTLAQSDGPRYPNLAPLERGRETAGGKLLSMQSLADDYRMHVRTLRKAAQDGRLQATFSMFLLHALK